MLTGRGAAGNLGAYECWDYHGKHVGLADNGAYGAGAERFRRAVSCGGC